MQDHIPDALITAFERQYDSSWNDPKLRNERLAMRYGWAAAMEAKQCLHQIQEPTVNQQLTDEREAFGIPQCPFPCGWKNLHSLLVAEGAFLARSLQEDDPITEHQRATVMRVVNYGLEMARAALAATPAEKSNSVEFDGIKTARPVVLPEPAVSASVKQTSATSWNVEFNWPEAAFKEAGEYKLYTEQQVRALLATGGQAQAVASIYVTEDGQRECDDWKVPLPVGRNLLYAAPQAQADARDAEIQQAVLAERERICAAIKAEDDHCVTEGDYMLDSDDCIKVARGEWVRPVYDAAIAAAKGE